MFQLPSLCVVLTVIKLLSCFSQSSSKQLHDSLLRQVVQMLTCGRTARNLLPFPKIQSCSSPNIRRISAMHTPPAKPDYITPRGIL